MNELMQNAKDTFGTTINWKKCGFILPDGSMVDLSGGANFRTEDHRCISDIYPDDFGNRLECLIDFMNQGAVRVMPEVPGIELSVMIMPTEDQWSAITDFSNSNWGNLVVDLCDKKGYPIRKGNRIFDQFNRYSIQEVIEKYLEV